MTVRELIIELTKYPMDAPCYAYEGERTGVVVIDPKAETTVTLGLIDATERNALQQAIDESVDYMDKY